MKTSHRPLTRLAFLTATAFVLSGSALAERHLQAALQNLQAAKAQLEKASGGKGGERLAAIRAIDKAIAEIRSGKAYDKAH